MFKAKVISKTIHPYTGTEISSVEVTYPRIILAQVNTHRVFTRSSSSSRAIPNHKIRQEVRKNGYQPIHWGLNQPGMQAADEAQGLQLALGKLGWHIAKYGALLGSSIMSAAGIHKQHVNRPLEPYSWTRTIITSTDWDNFFALRREKHAQPEIELLADLIYEALKVDGVERAWHMPYIGGEIIDNAIKDFPDDMYAEKCPHLAISSTAHCARVSYANHQGKVPTIQENERLFSRLVIDTPAHMSPAEHVAFATPQPDWPFRNRNFRDWHQFRAILERRPWADIDVIQHWNQRG